MIAILIILGVFTLFVVVMNAIDDGNQPRTKSTPRSCECHHSASNLTGYPSHRGSCLPSLTKEQIDCYIAPMLVEAAQRLGYERFPILGACAPRKCIADKVVQGTVFSVSIKDGLVWAIRDNGARIGCFPPNVVKAYMELPAVKRYDKVVVASDVNLNDKYGQCFVYPVVTAGDLIE